MPVAAPICLLLTTPATRTKGLWIGGVDVIKDPATGVGVELSTVEIVESVSQAGSLRFVIDDPNINVTVAAGMEVRFQNVTADIPIFRGWVQTWSYHPDFGNLGRKIEVTCVGVNVVLDWGIVATALTIATGTDPTWAVQMIVAQCVGLNVIRAYGVGGQPSSQANPIGPGGGVGPMSAAVTIAAGTTLREAIRAVFAVTFPLADVATLVTIDIDWYFGLRVYYQADPARIPTDWTNLTITDTIAGAIVSEQLEHETTGADIVRSLVVIGGNPAGSGTFSDGTGIQGKTAVLSDSTLLDATSRNTAAYNYLSQFSIAQRGSFSLTAYTPTQTIHAGSCVTITDTRASLAGPTYQIATIRKTFNSGTTENWDISYGGLEPSAMASLRRLTRTVLS